MVPANLVLEMQFLWSESKKEPMTSVLQSFWVSQEVVIQPLALSGTNVAAAWVEAEVTGDVVTKNKIFVKSCGREMKGTSKVRQVKRH